MEFLLCILIGYSIGTINPSYIIAKIHGFDIRKLGSGNAGASNALILLGKAIGVVCALLDMTKAAVAIRLCEKLFPDFTHFFVVAGVSCILGHIFPFYMKFKGGKGLACLGGMVLAFDWRAFLIMLSFEMIVALATNYICFVPLTASVIFPFVYGVMRKDWLGASMICLIVPLMILKHKENLRRIKNGTEMRLSYLWAKDAEIERIRLNEKRSG